MVAQNLLSGPVGGQPATGAGPSPSLPPPANQNQSMESQAMQGNNHQQVSNFMNALNRTGAGANNSFMNSPAPQQQQQAPLIQPGMQVQQAQNTQNSMPTQNMMTPGSITQGSPNVNAQIQQGNSVTAGSAMGGTNTPGYYQQQGGQGLVGNAGSTQTSVTPAGGFDYNNMPASELATSNIPSYRDTAASFQTAPTSGFLPGGNLYTGYNPGSGGSIIANGIPAGSLQNSPYTVGNPNTGQGSFSPSSLPDGMFSSPGTPNGVPNSNVSAYGDPAAYGPQQPQIQPYDAAAQQGFSNQLYAQLGLPTPSTGQGVIGGNQSNLGGQVPSTGQGVLGGPQSGYIPPAPVPSAQFIGGNGGIMPGVTSAGQGVLGGPQSGYIPPTPVPVPSTPFIGGNGGVMPGGTIDPGYGQANFNFSDENVKKNITPAKDDISQFLNTIKAHNYEYKDKQDGVGVFTSPMAQELEKTELGKQAVIDTPRGKMVNYGRLSAVNLAAVSVVHREQQRLQKQLDQLRKDFKGSK
jgi:hypothetical protein